MSQIYKNVAVGPVPPQVPELFITDVKDDTTSGPGHVVPALSEVNVLGRQTSQNNVNGIRTDADPEAGNFLYVELTNRTSDTTTTVDAATSALITLDLGSTAGVYTFDIMISGLTTSGVGSPLGCGYTIVGAIRTTGAAATLLPNQVVDHFEEGALGTPTQATAALAVSGNNALVNVTGKLGYNLNWSGTLTYNFVS